MDFDAKWIIGTIITVSIAVTGLFVGVFRNLSTKISTLHSRIDNVKDDYVRRDDFNTYIERIERSNARIEKSIERLDEKLDRFLTAKSGG